MTNADEYAFFINDLSGIIDYAEDRGFDTSGILSLQEAKAFFQADHAELFPVNISQQN